MTILVLAASARAIMEQDGNRLDQMDRAKRTQLTVEAWSGEEKEMAVRLHPA